MLGDQLVALELPHKAPLKGHDGVALGVDEAPQAVVVARGGNAVGIGVNAVVEEGHHQVAVYIHHATVAAGAHGQAAAVKARGGVPGSGGKIHIWNFAHIAGPVHEQHILIFSGAAAGHGITVVKGLDAGVGIDHPGAADTVIHRFFGDFKDNVSGGVNAVFLIVRGAHKGKPVAKVIAEKVLIGDDKLPFCVNVAPQAVHLDGGIPVAEIRGIVKLADDGGVAVFVDIAPFFGAGVGVKQEHFAQAVAEMLAEAHAAVVFIGEVAVEVIKIVLDVLERRNVVDGAGLVGGTEDTVSQIGQALRHIDAKLRDRDGRAVVGIAGRRCGKGRSAQRSRQQHGGQKARKKTFCTHKISLFLLGLLRLRCAGEPWNRIALLYSFSKKHTRVCFL